MCNLKSMILFKDKVYCPANTDSHSDMLEALKIDDDKIVPDFVKVEITPPNDDFFAPLTEWKYEADQDKFPNWYVKEFDEQRAFEALKVWANEHIFIGVNDLRICGNGYFYLRDCKNVTASGSATVRASGSATVRASGSATVEASGSATVTAWGSATVRAWGSATVTASDSVAVTASGSATVRALDSASVRAWGSASVEAWDSASVRAWGSASVRAWGSASVEAWDSATVRVWDSATVTAWGSASVTIPEYSLAKREQFIISENSTLKDCVTKTIYQAGDWKFEKVI